jgi:hypothetical protein
MKNIRIEFVPHIECRNNQIGDYGEDEKGLWFKIANDLGNINYSWACMLHELVEKRLKDQDGITDKMVDEWDETHLELDDPGLHPDSPYHRYHMMADSIEREFILYAKEDWIEYEAAIDLVQKEGRWPRVLVSEVSLA